MLASNDTINSLNHIKLLNLEIEFHNHIVIIAIGIPLIMSIQYSIALFRDTTI